LLSRRLLDLCGALCDCRPQLFSQDGCAAGPADARSLVYSSGAPSRTGGQDDWIDLDRDVGRRGQYEGVARSGVDRRAVVEPHFRVEDGALKPRDAYRRDAAASGAQQRERQRMGR
jgi:hypothetical protein